jgi:hypothetical protein
MRYFLFRQRTSASGRQHPLVTGAPTSAARTPVVWVPLCAASSIAATVAVLQARLNPQIRARALSSLARAAMANEGACEDLRTATTATPSSHPLFFLSPPSSTPRAASSPALVLSPPSSSSSASTPIPASLFRPMSSLSPLPPDDASEDPSHFWATRSAHVFIVTSAGKPVWTRWGDGSGGATEGGEDGDSSSRRGVGPAEEARLASLLQAVISRASDLHETIGSMVAGGTLLVFSTRGPLHLVAAARTGEVEHSVRQSLRALHAALLFSLTTKLHARLVDRPGADVRPLLAGCDGHLRTLLRVANRAPTLWAEAFPVLALPSYTRGRILQALATAAAADAAAASAGAAGTTVYAILTAGYSVVGWAQCRPPAPQQQQGGGAGGAAGQGAGAAAAAAAAAATRDLGLRPLDLALLTSFLCCTPALRGADAWTPVCLPGLSDAAFVHAYVGWVGSGSVASAGGGGGGGGRGSVGRGARGGHSTASSSSSGLPSVSSAFDLESVGGAGGRGGGATPTAGAASPFLPASAASPVTDGARAGAARRSVRFGATGADSGEAGAAPPSPGRPSFSASSSSSLTAATFSAVAPVFATVPPLGSRPRLTVTSPLALAMSPARPALAGYGGFGPSVSATGAAVSAVVDPTSPSPAGTPAGVEAGVLLSAGADSDSVLASPLPDQPPLPSTSASFSPAVGRLRADTPQGIDSLAQVGGGEGGGAGLGTPAASTGAAAAPTTPGADVAFVGDDAAEDSAAGAETASAADASVPAPAEVEPPPPAALSSASSSAAAPASAPTNATNAGGLSRPAAMLAAAAAALSNAAPSTPAPGQRARSETSDMISAAAGTAAAAGAASTSSSVSASATAAASPWAPPPPYHPDRDASPPLFLTLVTTGATSVHLDALSARRAALGRLLADGGVLAAVQRALSGAGATPFSTGDAPASAYAIEGLQHFLYIWKPLRQYTMSTWPGALSSVGDRSQHRRRKALLRAYGRLYARVTGSAPSLRHAMASFAGGALNGSVGGGEGGPASSSSSSSSSSSPLVCTVAALHTTQAIILAAFDGFATPEEVPGEMENLAKALKRDHDRLLMAAPAFFG